MLMTCDDEPCGLVMTGHCTRYQGPARRAQMIHICISALGWPASMNAGLSLFNLPDLLRRVHQNTGFVRKNFYEDDKYR